MPEATAWLNEHAFTPFIDEVRAERLPEVERIADHVELSLTEVLLRTDQEIGRATEDTANQVAGAEGRLAQAEARHDEAMARRERRRRELSQQRALTLQGVDRLTSVLVLPHPESEAEDVRRLRPNVETEMTAMRVVMEYECRTSAIFRCMELTSAHSVFRKIRIQGFLQYLRSRPEQRETITLLQLGKANLLRPTSGRR